MAYCKRPERTSASRNVVLKEHSHTEGDNINCFRVYGKQHGDFFFKKFKADLPYKPQILFLGIYTNEQKYLLQKINVFEYLHSLEAKKFRNYLNVK